MKKLIILSTIFALLAMPSFSQAATLHAGQNYSLSQGKLVSDNLYVVGNTATLNGDVRDDLSVAGGTVTISGTVGQDVLVGGGQVQIGGTVAGDVRAIGGTVIINGHVKGDVAVASGQVQLTSSSVVDGDLLVAGGHVTIDGKVHGNINTVAGALIISGSVDGKIDARADDVQILDGASIQGDLHYKSRQPAKIAMGAKIYGTTEYTEMQRIRPDGRALGAVVAGFMGVWLVVKFFMLLVSSLILVWIFRRLITIGAERVMDRPWHHLGYGLLFLIGMPFALLIAMMTVVGAPLAVLAGFAYVSWLLLAKILAPIILGAWLMKLINKKHLAQINWQAVLLGTAVIAILPIIPIVGSIAKGIIFLMCLGLLPHMWKEMYWTKR